MTTGEDYQQAIDAIGERKRQTSMILDIVMPGMDGVQVVTLMDTPVPFLIHSTLRDSDPRVVKLMELGSRRFDAAVCTMALMDMSRIEPLFISLSRLLKAGGRFVFSLTHPCFNSAEGLTRVLEQEESDGRLLVRRSIKMSRYKHPVTYKGEAMVGQPAAQLYFHRPISTIFNACFSAGFMLDGMEEPVFDPPAADNDGLTWPSFSEIPPVLVARMRLP